MKRISVIALIVVLALATAAPLQARSPLNPDARAAQKQAKKQQKAMAKQMKQQQKAMKKYAKDQRRALKKAQKDVAKRNR